MIGHIAALSSSVLWAGASILYTKLRADISAPALNLLKTGSAGILLWLTLILLNGVVWPENMTGAETAWLALSGILGLAIGDSCLFEAFGRIGPRRTLLISALAPALTALMAWPMLSEPITVTMVLGIGLTSCGVIWVIRDKPIGRSTDKVPLMGYGFALVAAIAQAAGCIATKLGGQHAPLELTVVRVAFGVLALFLYMGMRYDWRKELKPALDWTVAKTLIIAMLIGTYLGIWLQVAGLRYAPAGIAATLSSTSPIFVLPMAAIFLKDRLNRRSIIGAAIAVAGVGILCSPI